ncbi:MAG: bi-domain-containing oxidoreductase [Gammaproteobacteria bacterium]|nr:bi-domain-containing oxidoreductase [Gammaproteobacteria bacterium]
MKQVLQELGAGRTTIADVPVPAVPAGGLLIATGRTLISAGTERMLVEFSRAGWIEKARQQPEKVRQVIDKVRTDGPLATFEAVRGQLNRDLPLGYCNVGTVIATDSTVGEFAAGDRVVSNGAHAEYVAVSRNLCARVPDDVCNDDAAYTVLASIGLQGVRLAAPTIGETFAVVGLGLIGLLTVQILRANGCRVLGIDPDSQKSALAREFGAATVDVGGGEDPLEAAQSYSRGRGVDGVLIAASTKSDSVVSQAARMCRKRGRIVLVGVTGLKLNRSDFYEKELTFQVSCSYGPGRYDKSYEEEGQDYPVGFVRWTEQRNFEAVLDMIASGSLQPGKLTTHRYAIEDAGKAYDMIAAGTEAYLGVLLEYADKAEQKPQQTIDIADREDRVLPTAGNPVVGVIGSGNYASRILIPALARGGATLHGIASSGGQTAASTGRKFGFATATTDPAVLIDDPQVNCIVIATRHDSHAGLVVDSLARGKNVFVEKPMALNDVEIDSIQTAYDAASGTNKPVVMVGFNRRFAPTVLRTKELLESASAPKNFVVTVNAGHLPPEHWTQDPAVGGGRIIGEACHFIDLLRFLAAAPIDQWQVMRVKAAGGVQDDKATITLSFSDGSVGAIHYLANGHSSFPKERVEVFCGGAILQIDNFRALRSFGWKGFSGSRSWRQDKGQEACAAAFLDAVRDGRSSPIPFDQLLEVSRVTVAVGEAARQGTAGA